MKILFKIISFLAFFCFSLEVYACNSCGCAIGSSNLGILPQFHKNFLGVQYFYRGFNSTHPPVGTNPPTKSLENFHTVEFRGRFHLNKRIQLFVLLPYNINFQTEEGYASKYSGIGDISSFATYSVINRKSRTSQNLHHNLQIGGGIKLPSGNYKKLNNHNYLLPNMQVGTGSFDFLLNTIHTIRYKNYGINSNVFYRMNNTNPNDFRFGNRFNLASSLFYLYKLKKLTFLPNIGINYEHAEKDVNNKFIVNESGGDVTFSSFALDTYIKNITVSINYQVPLAQSNTNIINTGRFVSTLLYNFAKN